jgi:phenylacetate-CoA oxygenase PaaH subunit
MFAIYEVYADEAGSELTHVGSVRALSEKLAVQAAREIYFRRSTCTRLRVVRAGTAFESAAPEAELTQRNLDRTYRTPAFFVSRRYGQPADG